MKTDTESKRCKSCTHQGEFTIDELEKWLLEIAFHTGDKGLGQDCLEIIDRLDGFERFVADTRKEKKA